MNDEILIEAWRERRLRDTTLSGSKVVLQETDRDDKHAFQSVAKLSPNCDSARVAIIQVWAQWMHNRTCPEESSFAMKRRVVVSSCEAPGKPCKPRR